ncbi:hypothetical protein EB001_14905 [bacterium]|nr:hypothetical protein [bacterium]
MKIKNWDKFQHFKHKSDMKWFKCYGRDLLNDPDFMKMDDVKQATLFKLWCLASESNGVLPNAYDIAFRLRKPIAFVEKILIELDTWFIKEENIDKLYTNYITDKIREDKIIKTIVRFDEFWNLYPPVRKTNKKGCMEKWKAKDLDLIADKVIGYVKTMKETKQWKEGFVPAPMTLINQERWEDGNMPTRKVWEGGI